MKPIKFDDYANRHDCVSMKREDGILQLTIHGRDAPEKPCFWSNAPSEDMK